MGALLTAAALAHVAWAHGAPLALVLVVGIPAVAVAAMHRVANPARARTSV